MTDSVDYNDDTLPIADFDAMPEAQRKVAIATQMVNIADTAAQDLASTDCADHRLIIYLNALVNLRELNSLISEPSIRAKVARAVGLTIMGVGGRIYTKA